MFTGIFGIHTSVQLVRHIYIHVHTDTHTHIHIHTYRLVQTRHATYKCLVKKSLFFPLLVREFVWFWRHQSGGRFPEFWAECCSEASMHVCMYVCVCMCACIWMYVCMCVCVCICVYVCVCMQSCVCTRTCMYICLTSYAWMYVFRTYICPDPFI